MVIEKPPYFDLLGTGAFDGFQSRALCLLAYMEARLRLMVNRKNNVPIDTQI